MPGMATEFDSYAEGYLGNALTIETTLPTFASPLAKLCHAYGKVCQRGGKVLIRWQKLVNLLARRAKIQFNDFHSPSALHKLLAPSSETSMA